jgi:hypothetical protein
MHRRVQVKKKLFQAALAAAMIVPVSVPVYGENYRWKTVTAVRLVPFGTGTEWIITTGDITVSSGSVSLDTPANLGSNGGLLVANALTANGDFWGTSDVATSYPPPGVPYKEPGEKCLTRASIASEIKFPSEITVSWEALPPSALDTRFVKLMVTLIFPTLFIRREPVAV